MALLGGDCSRIRLGHIWLDFLEVVVTIISCATSAAKNNVWWRNHNGCVVLCYPVVRHYVFVLEKDDDTRTRNDLGSFCACNGLPSKLSLRCIDWGWHWRNIDQHQWFELDSGINMVCITYYSNFSHVSMWGCYNYDILRCILWISRWTSSFFMWFYHLLSYTSYAGDIQHRFVLIILYRVSIVTSLSLKPSWFRDGCYKKKLLLVFVFIFNSCSYNQYSYDRIIIIFLLFSYDHMLKEDKDIIMLLNVLYVMDNIITYLTHYPGYAANLRASTSLEWDLYASIVA